MFLCSECSLNKPLYQVANLEQHGQLSQVLDISVSILDKALLKADHLLLLKASFVQLGMSPCIIYIKLYSTITVWNANSNNYTIT